MIGNRDGAWSPVPYVECLQHTGDIGQLIDALSHFTIRCVVNGYEGPGGALTDELNERLGFPGNDPATSSARRDKLDMLEALAAAGLAHIPYGVASNPQELQEVAERLGSWPIVLKPINSGNAEDVFVCHNDDEANQALAAVVGKLNFKDQVNKAVLVEAFIDSDEYVVNTVSRDGTHLVTDIWKYDKRIVPGSTQVCRLRQKLLPREGDVQDALISYTKQALDALGVRNGAGHSEVFLTPSGPVLVETGARLMGGGLPADYYVAALEYPQLTALVDSMIDADEWERHLALPYRVREEFEIVNLLNERTGTVESIHGLDVIEGLPSFRFVRLAVKPGDHVVPTVDGLTCPGWAVLMSPDPAEIDSDYAALRSIERDLFVIAPDSLH